MKTHQAWKLALVNFLAIALGQVLAGGQTFAQGPQPIASASYATFSQGRPVVQQASFNACGACDGAGCGICGVTPVADGFRLSNLGHGSKRASQCGCGSGACGGGGGSCGGGMGMGALAGALGGGMGGMGGGPMAAMQAKMQSRGGGYGTMMHGKENGPFGGGGCCTPIWYDFDIGFMNLTRDYGSPSINLSSDGAAGPPVLNLNDVDADNLNGIRASYALLIGPSTNLELAYFGVWGDDSKSVAGAASPNGLYSLYSNFGDPTVPIFDQTIDDASSHSLSIDSELNNVELNCRRRWVSAGCLLHGSYLAGVRYLNLSEEFSFDGVVPDGGFLNYEIETENDAVGVQLGGDLFVCISPRFKLGLEVEGGIYGNDSSVTEFARTFEIPDAGAPAGSTPQTLTPINDTVDDTDVTFIGEANLTALFKITPRLTLRGGYTLLYLDNMALAQSHFNPEAPFASTSRTPVSLNNKEEVLYHGANVGITWMW